MILDRDRQTGEHRKADTQTHRHNRDTTAGVFRLTNQRTNVHADRQTETETNR